MPISVCDFSDADSYIYYFQTKLVCSIISFTDYKVDQTIFPFIFLTKHLSSIILNKRESLSQQEFFSTYSENVYCQQGLRMYCAFRHYSEQAIILLTVSQRHASSKSPSKTTFLFLQCCFSGLVLIRGCTQEV